MVNGPRLNCRKLGAFRGLIIHGRFVDRRVETILKLSAATAVFASTSAVTFAVVAAWFTHVVVCIRGSAWVFLAVGCLVFPVGVIHGFGIF